MLFRGYDKETVNAPVNATANTLRNSDMPQPPAQHLEQSSSESAPFFLADHPALDFLNTVAVIDGEPVDFLQSDEDVIHWLQRSGLAEEGKLPRFAGSTLLYSARTLRELIRNMVVKRKAGSRADTSAFNSFLMKAASYPRLVWESRKPPRIERVREHKTPGQVLASIAEAAADLIAHGDFDLIRECEDESCVLWFYDRTKSHRRRWCSMAACGNRNKVKAFRQRQQE
jgi:predicted RNA-binding Zn ribbon-like protein